MRRRALLYGAGAMLAAPLAAEAQPAAKIARKGWVGDNPAGNPHLRAPFFKDCVTSVTSRAATS